MTVYSKVNSKLYSTGSATMYERHEGKRFSEIRLADATTLVYM